MPDEYQRAETAAQLAEFCNEACIDGPKVSEELAAKKSPRISNLYPDAWGYYCTVCFQRPDY